MKNIMKNKNKTIEIHLIGDMVEIESSSSKDIGIEIQKIDPKKDGGPKGALYRIQIYMPRPDVKEKPFEYDTAWVMYDGTIVRRGEQK